MSDQTRFTLNETDLPVSWYNINADMPVPPTPVLHPQTLEPVTPDFLAVLFPMDLILQAISTERYIDIPEEVREIYKLWRPTPLIRARRLEKCWIPRLTFITNMKEPRPQAVTSQIQRCRRLFTIRSEVRAP